MLMFQIIGTSSGLRNSFALGYPETMLTNSETNHIFSTQKTEEKFFSKGFMDRGFVKEVKMARLDKEKECVDGKMMGTTYMFGGGNKSFALLTVAKYEKRIK